MKEKRVTKKAILASLLSVVVCSSMLIGTSYAWFTDSAVSSGNVIKSGTLDIDFTYIDGSTVGVDGSITVLDPTADGIVWKDASKYAIFAYDNWEPGFVQVRHVRVENVGTLALKYQFAIQSEGTVATTEDGHALSDVIDVYYFDPAEKIENRNNLTPESDNYLGTLTEALAGMGTTASGVLYAKGDENKPANGKSEEKITIVLKMNEQAGNDYQNLDLGATFSVQVLATQYTYEKDSFDDQYDLNADGSPDNAVFPVTTVSKASNLEAGITNAPTNGTPVAIKLANDVPDSPGFKVQPGQNVEIDLSGHEASVFKAVGSTGTETQGMQVLKGSSLTVKNGTFGGSNDNPNFLWAIHSYSDLTLENVTIDMTAYTGAGRSSASYGAVLVVDYGTTVVKGNTNLTAAAPKGWAVQVEDGKGTYYNNDGEATTVIFDESMTGTVDGIIYMSDLATSNPNTKPELIIKGGTFKNTGLTLDEFKEFVPEGYKVTTNGDGSWTVTKA